jgi:hypothetical protein
MGDPISARSDAIGFRTADQFVVPAKAFNFQYAILTKYLGAIGWHHEF